MQDSSNTFDKQLVGKQIPTTVMPQHLQLTKKRESCLPPPPPPSFSPGYLFLPGREARKKWRGRVTSCGREQKIPRAQLPQDSTKTGRGMVKARW